jgi:hypothetical protein
VDSRAGDEKLFVLHDPERRACSAEQWDHAAGQLGDVLFDKTTYLGGEVNDALLFALRDASERASIAARRTNEGEAV